MSYPTQPLQGGDLTHHQMIQSVDSKPHRDFQLRNPHFFIVVAYKIAYKIACKTAYKAGK